MEHRYAICCLNAVALRKDPTDRAEMVSQLRFGEVMSILEVSENTKWLRIHNFLDAYEGWVDCLQIQNISEEYFLKYQEKRSQLSIVASWQATCHRTEGKKIIATTRLSRGAILPFFRIKKDTKNLKPKDKYFFEIDKSTFLFKGKIFNANFPTEKELITRALGYRDTPYLWGGKSLEGVDCSGFVQELFKSYSILLPRDAYEQAEIGEKIPFESIRTGDLAFFEREEKVVHVGLVWKSAMELRLIHSRGQVRIDRLDSNGIWNETVKEYTHFLHSFRRIF